MIDIDGMIGRLMQLMQDAHLTLGKSCCREYSITEMVLRDHLRTREREENAALLNLLESFLIQTGIALQRMMENPDLVTLLRPLMAYNLSSSHHMRWIESENEYTTQVLYRFGFQWSTTSHHYVHRFVDTIVGFDYFKQ
jgi:hypothetical protein